LIRSVKKNDAESICTIYNYYVANTIVTFEESPVAIDDMALRIEETLEQKLPWFVAEENGQVIGYAHASKWKGRCAYKFSVEVTVYLSHLATTKGWGSKLYAALFSELEKLSFHVAIGGISLPNPASIALHEKFGMEKVGHFAEVGFKFDHWVDVGYWLKKLN